ncbi:hypothetical protein [Kordia sp.]|uniref:hypothetical protein n=1 Tax=Kordia sp. TaxID=1965332 RepID=UPI003D6A206C
MKRKKSILALKKFTIASVGKYHFIGGGQTNDGPCTTNEPTINQDSCQCYTADPKSCTSSTDDPLSNARRGCASGIGGGD